MSDQDMDNDLLDFESTDDEQDIEEAIEKFEKKVQREQKILLAKKRVNSQRRAKAAKWLGESGEITAINALQKVYRHDNDTQVKKAAQFALGQFKALQNALDDPELRPNAEDMLEDIILHGEFGKPASPSPMLLKRLMGILTGTFIVLMLLGMISGGGNKSDSPLDMPTQIALNPTAPPSVADVSGELLAMYEALDQDTNTLREQLLQVTRGESINCDIVFNNAQAYTLDPATDTTNQANLAGIIETLNQAQADLAPVLEVFSHSCINSVAINADDALTHIEMVVSIQRDLSSIPSLLGGSVTHTDMTAISIQTATSEATEAPNATVTPTVDVSKIATEISTLQFYLGQMNQPLRGYNTRLIQYWQDVQSTGSTGACLDTIPTLPVDYIMPSDVETIAPGEFKNAHENYNLGMELSRQSWNTLMASCADGTLADVVATQLIVAQTAQNAFNDADTNLANLNP